MIERLSLRWGQARERLLRDRVEKVTQTGIGQLRLELAGRAFEDDERASAPFADAFPPERCLADPGLTGDQERPRTVGCGVDERSDRGELGRASDDHYPSERKRNADRSRSTRPGSQRCDAPTQRLS